MGVYVQLKARSWMQKLAEKCRFLNRETQGFGVVEVILILVVLIGLVLIFKEQLTALVESIFEKITSESSNV